MKQYPKTEDFSVLIAEDVRIEPNGRFSLLGFYPGSEINVKEFGGNVGIQIAFMLMFGGDVAGDYNLKFELVSPSGQTIGPAMATIKKLSGRGVVQIVKLPNLNVSEIGNWQIKIHLDDVSYLKNLGFINNPAYFDT